MIFLNKINIGIVAHVDAGKTTVTENLLYFSGAIKKPGRVDSGNTQTDNMELERKRGITIKTSAISFNYENVKINILDTPGHTDFVSEVERSLSILDGAIIVISAVEGIQSYTKVLFDTLKELNIPTIIFINKTDRVGSNSKKLVEQIRKNLSKDIIVLQEVFSEGSKEMYLGGLYSNSVIEDIITYLSDYDDDVLEAYLDDEAIDKNLIKNKVIQYSKMGKLYPVLFGSALNGIGIQNLLNGIIEYLPYSHGNDDEALSAVIFKIDNSEPEDKKIYVRLFNGQLNIRDTILTSDKKEVEKIKKISVLNNCRQLSASFISAGDIGIIHGIKGLKIGDSIGIVSDKIKNISIAQPTLKTKVSAVNPNDNSKLYDILKLLAEEDPLLELEVGDLLNDIYLNLFGEIQMEILESIIKEKYGFDINFSDATTIYKEAPKGTGASIAHFNEPMNPFRAAVGIKVEPLEEGLGLQYISEVSTGFLPKTFQNAIEEAVYSTCKQGLLGWEVTDIKVTLYYGTFDSVTSTPSDFRNLTPMVLMEAIYEAKTDLLEPLYKFIIRVPQTAAGRTLSDLEKLRAVIDVIDNEDENFIVQGLIPVNTSKKYKLELDSYTEGKGVFTTKFYGYKKIPLDLGHTKEKIRIDPLNKKMYISYKLNVIR